MTIALSTEDLQAALATLRGGGLVAMPTETVYGLAADARNPVAVRRIFAAKGRPADHPVIVHLASAEQAPAWTSAWDDRARALAARFWPGPLTLVLPRAEHVLDEVTGGRPTVGLRVPSHPVAQALLRAFGDGLAAPSANRFGRISPTNAEHVRSELGPGVRVLDGGPSEVGLESTIVDLSVDPPALLRPGGIPRAHLEALLGPLGRSETVAPGTLAAHYAPRTSLLLSADPDADAARLQAQGRRVAVFRARPGPEHARALYAELRRLDALDIEVLVAERSADPLHAEAINDRLGRAAVGSGPATASRHGGGRDEPQ